MDLPPAARDGLSDGGAPTGRMRIWVSAGEVSGDRLAARLVRALREANPDLDIAGLAGPAMREAGVRPCGDALDFALAGWSSVLWRLPRLLVRGRRALAAARAFAPDLVVCFDAPGLHGPTIQALRSDGIRCVWVAPPQLWAWRSRRVPCLRGLEVFPLFSFERPALERSGARVRWWGFPGARPKPASPARTPRYLALLPGSRGAWRRRHEGLFRQAADLAALPLETVVAIPDGRIPGVGERTVSELWGEAGLALALPGTGVLEAASAGVPTVVAARPGRLDAVLARRRLVPGPLSLPNRILGREVFPELLGSPSAQDLARALEHLWHRRERVRQDLEGLEAALGDPLACERLAAHLLDKSPEG